jgi:hypothetical protein
MKLVMGRLLTTGSANTIGRCCELLSEVMNREYIGTIKKKLDDVYRFGGTTNAGRGEKAERDSRISFIVRCCFVFDMVLIIS